MATSSQELQLARQAYLWLMACMYMFAFASLYTQIPGLYGPNGLTPAHNTMPKLSAGKNASLTSLLTLLRSFPSVLVFHGQLKLSSSLAMELCCVVGSLLAFVMMIFRAMRCTLTFAMLWFLYLSVYKVGQVFLWFQWDSLLLEAGFLTILVAPFNLVFWKKPVARSHDGLTLWLVRWLLFRLMFASGVVKLTSQCPTWWQLTALNYHYESQCIPTPLSWYAHQFPEWFQKMCVVGTYFIEIAAPVLFFLPVRSLRLLGFWTQMFLQVLIIVTGNYNFFNLLTITLCFSLADDAFLSSRTSSPPTIAKRISQAIFGGYGDMIYSVAKLLTFVTVFGVMLALTVYYFDIQLDLKNLEMTSSIRFTSDSYASALSVAVPLLALMGALSLTVEIISAFVNSLCCPGPLSKVWSILQTIFFSSVVVVMFTISLVSHGVLDRTFYNSIPQEIMVLHNTMDQYSVTNPYGLFRRMTGVGGRPEVIIEGSNNPNSTNWKEYDFLYKPGDLYAATTYVAPHQPRLDWQMWFAALGSYQNNPWLVHLVYRLLIGQREVLQLMAPPPFKDPPRYIRARLYHYHFTAYDHGKSIMNQTAQWWRREFKSEYLFQMTWDNPGLKDYLNGHNYLSQPAVDPPPTPLLTVLTRVRSFSDQYQAPYILWTLFFSAVIATFTMMVMCPDPKGKQRNNYANYETISNYDTGVEDSPRPVPGSKNGGRGLRRRQRN